MHDFFPYTGKIPPVDRPGIPDLGASSNSVLHLAECIPSGKNHKIYFDNWFTSLNLVHHLATRQIWACGTIQERRLPGLSFQTDSQLKKRGRGSFDEHETNVGDTKITAVKWHDNRSVSLLSSFVNSHPVEDCKRYDKKTKKEVVVAQPNIVSAYNKHMGGVDLHDQSMAYYRMFFRSRKYYLRLVFHLIDMAVVNSWRLLRRVENDKDVAYYNQTSLCEFKLRLADALMMCNKDVLKKRGRPSGETVQNEFAKKKKGGNATKGLPEESIRKDSVGHWPSQNEKRGTCKYPGCSGKVRMFCQKCKVHLCCEPNRNCYQMFHQN